MPNLAPSGTDLTRAVPRSYTLHKSDFGFTDTDGNAFQAVVVTTLPGAGTLYYDSNGSLGGHHVAVTAGQVISAADILAGKLTYVAPAGVSGTNYDHFTFQVQDNGGIADGGVDTDQSPNTLTFDLVASAATPTFFGSLIDLNGLSASGFKIQGQAASDFAGRSVSAAGDVNGDGFADMLVGAYGNDSGGNSAGAAYVVFGKANGFGSLVDLNTLAATDGFKIQGQAVGDRAGFSISAAGDVNGDGFADILVGAYANNGGAQDAGATYVIFGHAGGFGQINLGSLAASDGFKIQGQAASDYSGISVSAAGDVNGDGFADILIGASHSDSYAYNAGAAYVVFGKAGGFGSQINLATLAATDGFKILGEASQDYAGASVSGAGDVNGDGFADILIGAARNDGGGTSTGAAYVIFGKAGGFGQIDLSSLAASAGFKIQGAAARNYAGVSVSAAGDVNGDGFADILVGAYQANAAYLVFGKAGGFGSQINLNTLAATDGFKIQGQAVNDQAGLSVSSAGDVNGDGFADMLVAGRLNDSGGINAGAAYVVFGKAGGFGSLIDLNALAAADGFKIQGQAAGDFAGSSVSAAGDINGDGFADIIVGALYNDNGGGTNAGAAYVIYGRANASAAPVLDLNGPDAGTSVSVTTPEQTDINPIAPAATLADPDSANFNGGSLTVSFGAGGTTSDFFFIHDDGGVFAPGRFGATGNDVYFNQVLFGTRSGGIFGQDLVVTLNANATPQAVEALVHNIGTFNSSDAPPSGPRTVTFTVTDGAGGTAHADASITIVAQNDAPVNGVPGAQAVNEEAQLVFGSSHGNALSVSDADAGAGNLTVTVSAAHGVLTLGGTGGLAFGAGDGTANATMTFTGTAAAINTALEGLTYAPAANYNGADSLSITTNDNGNSGTGGAMQDVDTVAINVAAVNDAPTLTGLSAAVTFAEDLVNATPQLLDADVTFDDVDGNFNGGHLTLSGLLAEDRGGIRDEGTGAGQIGISGANVSYGGIVIGTFTGGVGNTLDVTLNATATSAAVDALIQNLTYADVGNTPTASRSLVIDVVDAAGAHIVQAGAASTFSALTGAGNPFDGLDTGVSYTRPVFLDLDNDGDLDIIAGSNNNGLLTFRNGTTTAPGVFTAMTGTDNPFNGVSSFSRGFPALVDLDGDGDFDLVVGGRYNIHTFRNTAAAGAAPIFTELTGAANPFNGVVNAGNGGRFLSPAFVDLDGDGDLDAVVGVLDGSFRAFQNVAAHGAPAAFTELTGASNPLAGLNTGDSYGTPAFIDVDGDGDLDLISGVNALGFAFFRNVAAAGAPATFSQVTGAANPFNGLSATSQRPAPSLVDIDGDGDLDVVTGSVAHQLDVFRNNLASGAPIVVNVTAQNDAPVNHVPGAQALNEDAQLAFGSSHGNALSVSDADAGAGNLTITLSVAHGLLTLSGTNGLVFGAGDGSADATMTFTGTAAAINSALDGLTYAPAADYNGADSLTMTTSDNGASGAGGAQQDVDTVVLNVAAVNDAPTATITPGGGALGPAGNEILVNTATDSDQSGPQITTLANGGFVVTWSDHSQGVGGATGDATGYAVKAQVFAADGSPVGGEHLVNTATNSDQGNPEITALANGGFVVTWIDFSRGVGGATGDADGYAVKAQVFAADGSPMGSEHLVNTATESFQDAPKITALANGGFVVTWEDSSQGVGGATGDASDYAVKTQVFTANGTPIGGEHLVNTATEGGQSTPQITALANGGFVVTWNDASQGVGGATGDASSLAVKAQVFAADGTPVGGEHLVNTVTESDQYNPRITALANGGFVVAWQDYSQGAGGATGDTSLNAIKAQVFAADGTPIGGEQLVNTATDADQDNFQIAALANGGFVVTWRDSSHGVGGATGDTSGFAVKAQVFAADGTPVGGEHLVNTATESGQLNPQITALANGGFVVTWQDNSQGAGGATGDTSGYAVKAQVFAADGTPVGGEQLVNTATDGDQSGPQITALANGGFVVTWNDQSQGIGGATGDSEGLAVKAQVFGPAPYQAVEQAGLSLKGGLAVADADGGSGIETATVSVDYGVLHLAAGTSGATIANNDSGAVTITGTIAQINALLSSDGTSVVTYTANSDAPPGSATLTLLVNDGGNTGSGGALTASATTTIGITAVNDAPVNGVPGAQAVNEDAQLAFGSSHGNALSVSDADLGAGNLTVTLSVGHGVLTLSGTGGLVFGAGDGSADATMTFTGTAAAINTALAGLTYAPAANYNGADSLTITTNDNGSSGAGGAQQDVDTVVLNVAAINDTPIVVARASAATDEQVAVTLDPALSVHDADLDGRNGGAGDYAGAVLRAANNSGTTAPEDVLSIVSGAGFTVSGNQLLAGGLAFGTFSGGNGSQLVINFTSSGTPATTALVNAVAEALHYTYAGDVPPASVDISISLNDGSFGNGGQGAEPNGSFIDAIGSAVVTVNITAVDDAPVAVHDNATIAENAVATIAVLDNDTDVDGGPKAVVAIDGTAIGAGQSVTLASGAHLTVNANGTLSYDPNHVFDAIPTSSSGAANTPAHDSFTYTLTGGGTATVSVTVNGVDSDDYLVGTERADILDGGIGNDTIYGGRGGDTMVGRAGDDIYFVDNTGDQVIEAAGGGNDRILSRGDYTLYAGQSVEILSTDFNAGTAPIALGGNELDNIIYGNEGNNILYGKGGADYMEGRGGDDMYYVENARDVVVEVAGGGNDRILTSVDYTLHAGQSVEILTTDNNAGTAPIALGGNELDNIIYGNEGNNILYGKGGADYMEGRGGDDMYYVENARDVVVEVAGGGNDRILTSVDYTLSTGQSVEILSTDNNAGTTSIALGGNELDNIIYGNDGNNILYGKEGNDTLLGLGGNDQFWFNTALGANNVDTIYGFVAGSDKVVLFSSIFSGLAPGSLSASAFVVGSAAGDADDRIIYNNVTGALFYDDDGNGAHAAVQFATLNGAPAITTSDIITF